MKYKKLLFILALIVGVCSLAYLPINRANEQAYEMWKQENCIVGDTIFIDSTNLFQIASKCEGCHGFDQQGYANVDADGNDINVVDDWRASMMANSTRDPYWRAKVSQEIIHHGQYQELIEDKCTSCHAPMANGQSKLDGHPTFPFEHIFTDSLAMDGVSCGACHQMDPNGIGETFSGEFKFDTNRIVYGPYTIPFGGPMSEFVGLDPKFSEHMFESELCASCHTLLTESIDENGNLTENKFVEQATYHEWLNSKYSLDGTNCQTCHMEYVFDPVIISNNYIFLSGRKPYALHRFQGANSFMIELISKYQDSLGLDLPDSLFQEEIEATIDFLQTKSVLMDIEHIGIEDDSLSFELRLENLSGHKFPSGYPSRRAYIELVVSTTEEDTLFHSGKMTNDYRLSQIEDQYEPHFNSITADHQVQVYELVPGDENGQFTTILLRAFAPLKDNRLVPKGFSTAHSTYDTVLIAGKATVDPNFNIEDKTEGSGTDRIKYSISLKGYKGAVDISARLMYQSIPPEWVDELFDESHELIQQFEEMYNDVQPKPVKVAEVSIDSLPVGTVSTKLTLFNQYKIYPNPLLSGGILQLDTDPSKALMKLEIIDLNGKILLSENMPGKDVQLNLPAGTYIFIGKTTDRRFVEKIIIQ